MNDQSENERWRKYLQEAEQELQDKSRQWEQAQQFLCGTISKLAHIVDDETDNLASEISLLKKAASDFNNFENLQNAVNALTQKVIDLETHEQPLAKSQLSAEKGIKSLLEKLSSAESAPIEIKQLQSRVSKIDDQADVAVLVEDILKMWQSSKHAYENEKGDPTQFCALLISEILYQLLEKISLPRDISQRLNRLKDQLESGVTITKWAEMLNEIANVASDVQLKINNERLDIEEFLKQVTTRLKELDAYIQGTNQERQKLLLHGQAFGDAVKSEMQNLASSADDAVDIDTLKSQIQSRLAAIEEHINGFSANADTDKVRTSEDDVKRLMHRLTELEQESQNLKARVQKERLQAQIDTLTGIANRLGYDNRISQEYARWKRFENPLSLIVWDVDHFKKINDNYGHAAGDKALKVISKLLSEKVRETDYLARYGGEEFVLIMPGADSTAALGVAEKLRETVEASGFHFKDQPVSITISAGVAEFSNGDTPQAVFERADNALYNAKEAGRNRVVVAN